MPAEARTVPPVAAPDLAPDIFEALVSIWTEILYEDYLARHPEHPEHRSCVIMRPLQ